MSKKDNIFNYLDVVEGEAVTENKEYPKLVALEFDIQENTAKVYVSRWRSSRGIARKRRTGGMGMMVQEALARISND